MQPAFSSTDSLTPDQLNARAREMVLQQRFDEAESLLHASLQKDPTATAFRLLGNIAYSRGDLEQAVAIFNEALSLDAHDHASMAMLAEVHFRMGDVNCAGYSIMAMTERPEDIRYKERFIHFSAKMAFSQYSPLIENAIIECLKTPGLDCSGLQALWYNTFSLSPEYKAIYKTFRSSDPVAKVKTSGFKRLFGKAQAEYVFFDAENFARAKNLAPLLNPFFTLGLKNLLVHSLAFEEFLVALRARLLNEAPDPDYLPLASALAAYSFRNGYIFPVTPEEQQKIDDLRPRLEAGLPEGKEWQACLYGCYVPLYKLRNAGMIAEAFAGLPFVQDLVREQIYAYFTLEEVGETLRDLTPVKKAGAARTAGGFPYPLWTGRPKGLANEPVSAPLTEKGAQILVAGCGTGLEAAEAAVAFPDSSILAVDLDRLSLAYGALKAKELNLHNIDFGQADTENLNTLNRRFDGIFCDAMHLPAPVETLKTFGGILNAGGLMRISLYSGTGRANIATAQDIVRAKGFLATLEGIRAFRAAAARLLPYEIFQEIARTEDYYQLSRCRDMLFPDQEHRFDLLKIKEILAGLSLEFLKMNVPSQTLAQFRAAYPGDPGGRDLENWHDFERRTPDTFMAMYQFWCRKSERK